MINTRKLIMTYLWPNLKALYYICDAMDFDTEIFDSVPAEFEQRGAARAGSYCIGNNYRRNDQRLRHMS